MPRPSYIICSQGGSQDKLTDLLSLYGIIEKLTLADPPKPDPEGGPVLVVLPPFRVTAVWMKAPEDSPDQEFTHELMLVFPGDNKLILQRGPVKFTRDYWRSITNIHGPLPFTVGGILEATSRLQSPNGETLSQTHRILVDDASTSNPNGQP